MASANRPDRDWSNVESKRSLLRTKGGWIRVMVDLTVTNNEDKQQYEALIDGSLAVAQYKRRGNALVFHHTEVPRSLRGRGVASALVHSALDDARTRGLTVVPTCSFVSAYISKHPEYLPLVEPDVRRRLG
jgi:uncharacterized protein